MTSISYRIVVNESTKEFYGETEFNFCKSEVDFVSEDPYKARSQAIDYLNYVRKALNFSKTSFIQFFLIHKGDNGEPESMMLSNGYNIAGHAKVREENLRLEKELYRKQRFVQKMPLPVW